MSECKNLGREYSILNRGIIWGMGHGVGRGGEGRTGAGKPVWRTG